MLGKRNKREGDRLLSFWGSRRDHPNFLELRKWRHHFLLFTLGINKRAFLALMKLDVSSVGIEGEGCIFLGSVWIG